MPNSYIQEYKAYSYLEPFDHTTEYYREGLKLQSMVNQNVAKKKDLRSAADILPYLKEPEWIITDQVKKAKQLLQNAHSPEMKQVIIDAINEEINKTDCDYTVHHLQLIKKDAAN